MRLYTELKDFIVPFVAILICGEGQRIDALSLVLIPYYMYGGLFQSSRGFEVGCLVDLVLRLCLDEVAV